jgi:predicted secreted protein
MCNRNLITFFLVTILIINKCYADQKLLPIPIYTDSSQTITVTQKSPEFTIQLKANPTTGYTWITKKYDQQLLTLVNYHYNPPSLQMPGAGGIAEWDFRAKPQAFVKTQTTIIHLLYARSWDLTDHPTNVEFKVLTK